MEISRAIHFSGNLHILLSRKALNKVFLKVKNDQFQVGGFKRPVWQLYRLILQQ